MRFFSDFIVRKQLRGRQKQKSTKKGKNRFVVKRLSVRWYRYTVGKENTDSWAIVRKNLIHFFQFATDNRL